MSQHQHLPVFAFRHHSPFSFHLYLELLQFLTLVAYRSESVKGTKYFHQYRDIDSVFLLGLCPCDQKLFLSPFVGSQNVTNMFFKLDRESTSHCEKSRFSVGVVVSRRVFKETSLTKSVGVA